MTDTNNTATPENLPAMLAPAARAALALKSTETELQLLTLVQSSADITAVLDDDGREQAHRIAMVLRNTRTGIEKAGKAARDDATKFSKAVIAEEKRLIDLITPEETRVLGLRDDYDAEQARIQAEKIAAERARTEAHEAKLAGIARIPVTMLGASAADVLAQLAALEELVVGGEWEEFIDRAVAAYGDAITQLQAIYRDKLAAEEAAAAEAAAREAERQRIAAEQAELARQRAEQEQAARDLAEQQAALRRQQEEAARAAAAEKAKAEAAAAAQAAEMKRQMDELAAARAAFEEEQNRAAAARRAAEELERDHAEALAINAAWQPPAAAPDVAAEEVYEQAIAAEEAPAVAAPAELLDLPEAEPSDAEIIEAYTAAFGGSAEDAMARLIRFAMDHAG